MRIMNPKARITYRFETAGHEEGAGGRRAGRMVRVKPQAEGVADTGGDGRRDAESPAWPEESAFGTSLVPWRSPFQDDPDALERLIRETDGRMAEEDAGAGAERAGETGFGGRADRADGSEFGGAARHDSGTEAGDGTRPGGRPGTGGRGAGDGLEPSVGAAGDGTRPGGRPGTGGRGAGDDWDPSVGASGIGRLSGHAAGIGVGTGADGGTVFHFPSYRRRRPAPSWIRAAATVIGAVLTGALFGWLVMTLIFWQAGSPGPADAGDEPGVPADHAPPSGEPAAADPVRTEDRPDTAGSRIAVGLPAVRYHVLQYGVFSTAAGLEEALAQLGKAGFPAGADTEGGYRAYAGIADSREGAEALAASFGGVELYIRPLDIPAVAPEAFAAQPEAVPVFLLRTGELIRTAGGLSASLLSAGGTNPVPDEAWSDWEAVHREWSEAAEALPDETAADEGIGAILGAVGRAADAFAAYRKEPEPGLLREIQSALIGAAVALRDRTPDRGAL